MRQSILVALAMLLLQSTGMGAYSLTWSPVTSSASVGAPIVVDLFLNETVTTRINDSGAFNANITVTTTFGTLSAPLANTLDFDVTNTSPGGTVVDIAELALGSSGGQGNGNSIRLGTFTINTVTLGSGMLTVSLTNGLNADIGVNDGLGGQIFVGTEAISNAQQFSFTAVPEPTSLVTASGIGLVGAWVARRRKAKKQIATA